MLQRAHFVAVSLAALCMAESALAQLPAVTPGRMPPPRPAILAPEARVPIQISRLKVEAEIVGAAAHTRIEVELRNPNALALEAQLQFPLRPEQTVTGFALDFDGELRPAVPVEKAKAQQVFEDVTRTRVDPALLESAGGNHYKLRVYPLPAGGTRRVVLEISEALGRRGMAAGGPLDYQLPLAFGQPIGRFEAVVRLPGVDPRAVTATLGAERIALARATDGAAQLAVSRDAYIGQHVLRLGVTGKPSGPHLSTQAFRGSTYFYAEVPAASVTRPRAAPRTVALLWDASGSGAGRDHGREYAVLDHYFRALGTVAVDLVVVRDAALPPQRFTVVGGNWRALREALEKLPYDGATNLGAMAAPPGANVALLFSDGLGNYGGTGLPVSAAPLYALVSSAGADTARLQHAAQATGGTLLDLLRLSAPEASGELRTVRNRLVGLRGTGAADLVSAGVLPHHGRLALAGRLTEPAADVEVEWEAPDGRRSVQRLRVVASGAGAATQRVAAPRWAALRLAEWDADRDLRRAAIRELGMAFGLVTTGTSLIVLDAAADYVRHEIEPPASLRPLYEKLLAQKRGRDQTDRTAQLNRVAERFAAKQAWWEQSFPKGDIPPPPPKKPAPPDLSGQQRAMAAPVPRAAPTPSQRMMAPAPSPTAAARPPGQAAIQLKKWMPDLPYAKRLREARAEDLYAVYLDERGAYTRSTAFFLDASDIFLERGQAELALRILSNLAEMDLDNRHILRILGYRLLQAKHVKLALPVLRKALELSPGEPQSYRDLGLALAHDGQYQQAVEHLWEVVVRPWHNRFPDIELVALAELNAIAAQVAHDGKPALDMSRMDARLLRNLPLELRAVLAWDADNTDIDLWVIDPNGERAYYGRPLTYQGGRMSNDFTGGYGPEEFSLRYAKPGTYTVKAQFYGHRQQIVAPATTLMLKLTTGFGTPGQKDSDVVLRLGGQGQEVTVGTFAVPGSAETGNAPSDSAGR